MLLVACAASSTPCKWSPDCTSFIVLDAVRVAAPFTSSCCSSITATPTTAPTTNKKNNSAQATAAAEVMLTRVRKIVDAERTKLKLKL
jgi:hypothetical protein